MMYDELELMLIKGEEEVKSLREALITALAYIDNAQSVLKQALEDEDG